MYVSIYVCVYVCMCVGLAGGRREASRYLDLSIIEVGK